MSISLDDVCGNNLSDAIDDTQSPCFDMDCVPRDVWGVIFEQLNPIQLWRAAQVSSRWRRIILERVWKKEKMDSLQEYLRRQRIDFYEPYNRLSHYDRDYESGELQIVWPKRPLLITNWVPEFGDGSDHRNAEIRFIEERLSEIFDTRIELGARDPVDAVVQWEGHEVRTRVVARLESIRYIREDLEKEFDEFRDSSSHEIQIVWACNGGELRGMPSLTPKQLSKLEKVYRKDFFATQNVVLNASTILCRSYSDLCVGQIYELIRGQLPTYFPTVSEFETALAPEIVARSQANFATMRSKSALGIDVPRTLPGTRGNPDLSTLAQWFSAAEWKRWYFSKLIYK